MLRKILMAIVVATLPAPSAMAESVCGERGEFLQHLSQRYSEAPVAMGLASNGSVIEVLASEQGSWTILLTTPNGITCLVATGDAWESLKRIAVDPKA